MKIGLPSIFRDAHEVDEFGGPEVRSHQDPRGNPTEIREIVRVSVCRSSMSGAGRPARRVRASLGKDIDTTQILPQQVQHQ